MPRTPNPQAPEPEGNPEDDAAVLRKMGGFAAAFEAAAGDEEKVNDAARAFFELTEGLTPAASKRLFSRPEVRAFFEVVSENEVAPASRDDPPGTIYSRVVGGERIAFTKKPWTWADAWKIPTKTWEPSITETLGFQGLLVTVFAQEQVTLPEVFYGIYHDCLKQRRIAQEHAAWIFKKRDTLSDPSVTTEGSRKSRGIANHDGKVNIFALGAGPIGPRVPGDIDYEAAG